MSPIRKQLIKRLLYLYCSSMDNSPAFYLPRDPAFPSLISIITEILEMTPKTAVMFSIEEKILRQFEKLYIMYEKLR